MLEQKRLLLFHVLHLNAPTIFPKMHQRTGYKAPLPVPSPLLIAVRFESVRRGSSE